MTTRATVIGIGNEFRRDDGVGPAVIAELRRHAPAGVALVVSDGDPTRLLEAWDGVELAIVVDAVRCAPPEPGRIHRTSIDDYLGSGAAAPAGGSHGLGLPDAVRLAEVMERTPRRLVVYAVEAADLGIGPGLSAPVARAVTTLVTAVLDDLGALVSESSAS